MLFPSFLVSAPTDPPLSGPTSIPTPPPFFLSDEPTGSPILDPTNVPTSTPITNIPTVQPITSSPTVAPVTSAPMELPTTQSPTMSPVTASPTTAPIISPTTAQPTASPNIATADPSDQPSATPSSFLEFETASLSIVDVRLSLRLSSPTNGRKLQGSDNDDNGSNCTQILQNALMRRIEGEVDTVIQTYEMLLVDVQNLTSTFSNASLLMYVFDVSIEIRSPMQEYEPNRYVEGPFDSQVEKNLFSEELRSTECAEFADVATIDIVVPRKVEDASPSDDNASPLSVGLLAAIVAACAAVMFLIAAVFIVARMRRRNNYILEDDSSPRVPQKQTFESNEYTISEIDGANTNTDISTLGDPILPFGSNGVKKDIEESTIGSVNMEYDFKKAFLDIQSVTDSQLFEASDDSSPRRRIGTLDDPSLLNGGSTSDIVTAAGDTQGSPLYESEEQYDIVAPSGLLGLILESTLDDGRPTVHNIKPTSPLAHVVKIGDRLIAVDGENVSSLRASDVSRLIAAKKDKARVLLFSRPMKNDRGIR
jgi:hypothetical protein